jgi:GTP-binding protein HflX
VVDITHPSVLEQVATVLQVLDEIDAAALPIITALNKIDGLPASDPIEGRLGGLPDSVAVSAITGEGLPALTARIEETLSEELVGLTLLLPYQRGDLLGFFHQRGVIDREEHLPDGTLLWGRIPAKLAPRFQPYHHPPRARSDMDEP